MQYGRLSADQIRNKSQAARRHRFATTDVVSETSRPFQREASGFVRCRTETSARERGNCGGSFDDVIIFRVVTIRWVR